MRVLKVEKGKQKVVNYPRFDNAPITGLNPDIEFYSIYENQPNYDKENEYIQLTGYELTDDNDPEYPHLKIAKKQWDIVAIQREKSIEERVKDAEELILVLAKEEKDRTQADKDKINEIKSKIETKNLRNART